MALLAALLARTYVGSVYRIESTSMEPTLHAQGERVFVRYQRAWTPERFALIVFTPAGESAAVVKRVAGLPLESLLISGGDLLIEGKRLAVDAPRPVPITIFDSKLEPLDQVFSPPSAPFARIGEHWRWDARGRRDELQYARRATDDHFDAAGVRVAGLREVNDLRMEGRFVFHSSGVLTLKLTEEGDSFELELKIESALVARARLLRRSGAGEPVVLAELDWPDGREAQAGCDVSLENIDNYLIAVVGAGVLSSKYEANTPLVGVIDESYRHLKPRAALAVAELEFSLESLVLARDLFYTPAGSRGTGSAVALGRDELFLLGDNSADSRDSRTIGAIPLSEVAGRPVGVVWPPRAMRSLGGLRVLPQSQAAQR
jgi:type IV secretory pathway protease TraF